MATNQWSFQGTLDRYVEVPNIHEGLRYFRAGSLFLLQIRTFIEDDNGNFMEDGEAEFQQQMFFPNSAFGSSRHREYITQRLREAGYLNDEDRLRRMLERFFRRVEFVLESLMEKNKSESESVDSRIPRLRLCVRKLVRREDGDLEARVAELSMQEGVKTVPATKQSIGSLQKVKIEGCCADEKCMICMEQLTSGTQEVSSMPCSHLFHGHCIEEWLNLSHMCPLCRFPMPTDE